MDDTGGRRLVFEFGSVYNNEEDRYSLSLTSVPEIFSSLSAFNNPGNFDALFCKPIEIAKVVGLVRPDRIPCPGIPLNRYNPAGRTKPAFIQADILFTDLNRAETYESEVLARVVRERGFGAPEDDCGHIIARQFGGRMIDYNLFPQNKHLNRGWGAVSHFWKYGIELIVRTWLESNSLKDPMVRFRVLLIYPGNERGGKPDRPLSLHYHMQFYRKESEDENTEKRRERIRIMKALLKAALAGEIINSCMAADGQKTKAAMRAFCAHLRNLRQMTQIRELREIFDRYIEAIEELFPEQLRRPQPEKTTPKPLSANRPFSWWDLVPIVSSVRTMQDAGACYDKGDTAGAVINTALGLGGLAVDVLSLGSFGAIARTALKEGTKIIVKEVVKEGTKVAAKRIVQEVMVDVSTTAIKQIAKEGLKTVAKTSAVPVARRGIEIFAANP